MSNRKWRAMMKTADAARDAGRIAEAATLYRAVTDRFPGRLAGWVQFGNMSKDTGNFTEARQAYQRALAIAPGDADVHIQLGHLAKLQGEYAEAGTWYEAALAIDPGSAARGELVALGVIPANGDPAGHHRIDADLTERAALIRRRLASHFNHRRA